MAIWLVTSSAFGDEPLSFERDIRLILKAHCFHCHGEEPKPRGGLDLRLVRGMMRGGGLGPALVPGQRDESLLWVRVEEDEMPPVDKKLSAQEKALLASWIDQGARTLRPEPEDLPPGPVLTEEERAFWSFQPIRRHEVPAVRGSEGVGNPIDAFLLAKLEANGLSFAPEADRPTLIRRATFDLTGLPPTPEEVEAFVHDPAPDAYERLIDRLLASPHFGEQWARHWMDIAGYADSDGVSPKDEPRPYAHKYRDYLVRALNADRPWDELVREQLAGDEMLEGPVESLGPEQLDRLIATGFLRMAPDGTADASGADAVQARNDVIAETVKIASTSLLGLTVGCAQCHAHRYDPISHEDYHRFRALFEPALDPAHWKPPQQRLISLWNEDQRRRAAEVDAEIQRIRDDQQAEINQLVDCVLHKELNAVPEELRDRLREARDTPKAKRTPEQNQLLKDHPRVLVNSGNVSLYDAKAHRAITAAHGKRIAEAQARRPPEDFAHALTEVPGQVPATHLLDRGDPNQPRQVVEPGELSVIAATVGAPKILLDDPNRPTTGRRLAYARHLTSGRHPLVTRVLVNRFWMHLFGRGIVNTPADFGVLGERPSHPELLDWLADQFVQDGWSLKAFLKRAMTSTAYRQTSVRRPEHEAVDPENRLLGRMSVRRLEAEAVRDAILAVSGSLHHRMFGTAVPVSVDDASQVVVGIIPRDGAGRPSGKPVDIGAEAFRRGVYIQARRSLPLGFTEAFDAPVMSPNCERRAASTVAPQALMLMNHDFVVAQAAVFARRVEREAGDDPAARVRRAWTLALSREPTSEQVSAALAFLDAQEADFAARAESRPKPEKANTAGSSPSQLALASFAQALLGSNAFLYID
jgi:hypothetical protein